jgi:hypothetical protein
MESLLLMAIFLSFARQPACGKLLHARGAVEG